MSELIENTKRLLTDFNDKIKSDLATKNIDNSGEASNSIRIETKETKNKSSVTSLGVFYLEYLNRGRPPGKFPPVKVIEEWVKTKPVEINPYLVGRKIAREGTTIFKDRSKGIELEKKTEEVRRVILEEAPKWAKNDVLIEIKGITNQLK